MPLVPQRVCFPSSLLSTLVPQASVADMVHYLHEKREEKPWGLVQQSPNCLPSICNKCQVNPNVVYIEDGLNLLLLFWFGLPCPCRTTIPPIIIIRQQATTTPAEAAPHCVVDSCLGSLLRVCHPSALALRWFWWNMVAKQRIHLQQHHVDVAVFLQICWTAATLRGTEESL